MPVLVSRRLRQAMLEAEAELAGQRGQGAVCADVPFASFESLPEHAPTTLCSLCTLACLPPCMSSLLPAAQFYLSCSLSQTPPLHCRFCKVL